MYRTAELEQDLKRRNFEGFKFKKEIMGYSWTQKRDDVVRMIVMGYRRYTTPGESSVFYLYRPSIYLRFPKVELILGHVMKKFDKRYQDKDSRTIQALINPVEKVDYEAFNIRISSTEAFDCVYNEVEDIVYNAGMPFFNKYQTLESVANLLVDKTPTEIAPLIPGSILFPKTMLILKLANHSRYEEKLIEFRKILNSYIWEEKIPHVKKTYEQTLLVYDELFREDIERLITI